MTLQVPVLQEDAEVRDKGFKIVPVAQPYTALARAVLRGSVKNIQLCPRTITLENEFARTRARQGLMRALEALRWAHDQPGLYVLWCETAEIGADWLSEHMIALASKKSLLMKAWEAQK